MSRKVNQSKAVQDGIATATAVQAVTNANAQEPGTIAGGASGAPPATSSASLNIQRALQDRPGERVIPPDQMPPPPRRFRILNDETIPGTGKRGISVMVNRCRVHFTCGREVTDYTHDIEGLRAQGVRFEEISPPAPVEAQQTAEA